MREYSLMSTDPSSDDLHCKQTKINFLTDLQRNWRHCYTWDTRHISLRTQIFPCTAEVLQKVLRLQWKDLSMQCDSATMWTHRCYLVEREKPHLSMCLIEIFPTKRLAFIYTLMIWFLLMKNITLDRKFTWVPFVASSREEGTDQVWVPCFMETKGWRVVKSWEGSRKRS